jgi:hypothetical protein
MVIPQPLAEYIEAKDGNEIELMADRAKHGKFVSFWNPKQQGKK